VSTRSRSGDHFGAPSLITACALKPNSPTFGGCCKNVAITGKIDLAVRAASQSHLQIEVPGAQRAVIVDAKRHHAAVQPAGMQY
jgi:hypothetical protein